MTTTTPRPGIMTARDIRALPKPFFSLAVETLRVISGYSPQEKKDDKR